MSDGTHAEHFESPAAQERAARLGMWIFLGSEALLFAGLFALYAASRWHAPQAFREGVTHASRTLGSINTALLLVSSTLAALALDALERGRRRLASALLVSTALLGVVFEAIKLLEYRQHVAESFLPGGRGAMLGGARNLGRNVGLDTFWNLYYATTGLHAVHVAAGVVVLLAVAVRVQRGTLHAGRAYVVHNATLYWHLVDLIWVFVWPMFYLA